MLGMPVVNSVEELTLVVVTRESDLPHPQLIEPPANPKTLQVFAQQASESALHFDARLRECLEDSSLLQSLPRAALVCTPETSDREILRRLRLVAARVKPGGSVMLSYNDPSLGTANVQFTQRIERLAHFATSALSAQNLTLTVLPTSQLREESAPLSSAWHRLQRQRANTPRAASEPSSSSVAGKGVGDTASPGARQVTRAFVCHQRRTKTATVEWTSAPSSESVVSAPFHALGPCR